MPAFARRVAVPAPLSRTAAFAVLLAAPLMVSPLALTPAHAQTTTPPATTTAPATPGTSATNMNSGTANSTTAGNSAETIDQRIANLKTQLQITPKEENDWNKVAQAMRQNAQNMQQLIDQQKSKTDTTALNDLTTYEQFAQAHARGVQNLIGPFRTLYDSMPASQQKVADNVFNNYRNEAQARRQEMQQQSHS